MPSPFSLPSLQFSGHETFALRQLWLRKAYGNVAAHKFVAPRSVFSDESAIADFGVGKNMVNSIRHWSLACGVIEERNDGYAPTELAHALFGDGGLDPYLEYPATVWLIHWKVAGIGLKSSTWWYVFNCVVQQSFNKESLLRALTTYTQNISYKVSVSTLGRDIDVCLASYLPRAAKDSNDEDVAEPILAELPLLQQHLGMKGTFSFRRGPKPTLPDALFAYSLLDFWERDRATFALSFDRIMHDYGSPGRVFKLDEYSVAERVSALEHLTKGMLQWTDTAGIRQVSKSPRFDATILRRRLLETTYA